MPKTLQIRDVDDDVYAALASRAARNGTSVPELVREELSRIAALPTALEWLTAVQRPVVHSKADPVSALDESRGKWPRARR
ncbi:MAG: hypothetical protein U0R28_13785 [Candidatus Nanopelagicales bacterium]